jgi:hypothetical protein
MILLSPDGIIPIILKNAVESTTIQLRFLGLFATMTPPSPLN